MRTAYRSVLLRFFDVFIAPTCYLDGESLLQLKGFPMEKSVGSFDQTAPSVASADDSVIPVRASSTKTIRNQYDCYASWGFRENPFQPSPLHPNQRGERLLVGRDEKLQLVKSRMHKHGKITCIEGPVGIGKTSLVNIAAYQCLQGFLKGDASQLLIPCNQAFQLTSKISAEEFSRDVFIQVAQTLINEAPRIAGLTFNMQERGNLDAWLNSPLVAKVQLGLKAFLEINQSTSLNNSGGFNASGFEKLVRSWLTQIFPQHGSGGVVCIIDNIELLETGPKAKKVLEALRDRLFSVDGLRWVVCGANGIVSSVVASPRLSGYLIRPVLELSSINGKDIPTVVDRRIEEFSYEQGKEYLPIHPEDLQHLYMIINFNLRDLLAHADDYCTYIFEHGSRPEKDADKRARFETWLNKQTLDQYADLQKRISRDAWELLDTAMSEELKGNFGPGDFSYFKKNSFQSIEYRTFMLYMRKFEDLGVVARIVNDSEDDEKKRTIFSVTSKGALVHYARVIKKETHTLASPWLRRSTPGTR